MPTNPTRASLFTLGALAAWTLACTGGMPGGETAPACDLALDKLAGKSFVYLEALPGGATKEAPIARIRFDDEGGKLAAKYTVASLSDVYTMPCTERAKGEGKELFCAEESRPRDWCQALLVGGGECTKKALKEYGATQDDEALNAAIKEAKETVAKYKGGEEWKKFELNNNNLGNKLQGRLYVSVDDKRCQLSVGDFYWTVFNGKPVEDSNPVGQNPFVKSDQEWLFEHCTEGGMLPGIESEELPADLGTIPRARVYDLGTPYWFHYLGENARKAEEGCTYDFDVWSQWKPVSKAVPATVTDKGEVVWKLQHTFAEPVSPMGSTNTAGVLTLIRHKTCGGKREKIDVICEGAMVR